MKKILSIIEGELKQAFSACGYHASYGKAVLSNRPDLCEYQCNGAMAAAKAYRKKPIDIARQVVEELSGGSMFSLCQAVMPGFINLRLSEKFLADYLKEMADDQERLGLDLCLQPKTIMVDYG